MARAATSPPCSLMNHARSSRQAGISTGEQYRSGDHVGHSPDLSTGTSLAFEKRASNFASSSSAACAKSSLEGGTEPPHLGTALTTSGAHESNLPSATDSMYLTTVAVDVGTETSFDVVSTSVFPSFRDPAAFFANLWTNDFAPFAPYSQEVLRIRSLPPSSLASSLANYSPASLCSP
jgi:hypothetical protein